MLEWCRSYSADCPGAKSISYVLIMWQMMAIDLQPFSIVSDVGFCHLLAELEPRTDFSEVLIRTRKSQAKNFRAFEFCQLHKSNH